MSLAGYALNRLLEREAWARERLAAHTGRRFTIEVGPTRQGFRIDAVGLLADEPSVDGPSAAIPPDLRVTLPMSAVPAFLADPRRWHELVSADGDTALAGTLAELATTLPWFVERAFASALGPIAGKRAADAGRAALATPEYIASRMIAGVARHARDESQLLARPEELEHLARDLADVSSRADAVEARVLRLEGTPGRDR